jgi:hypothetical protein
VYEYDSIYGWMSANDIRELENLDLIPAEEGGDLYLINGNMGSLVDAGKWSKQYDGADEGKDMRDGAME